MDWTFNGRLTTYATSRGIVGKWTQVSWSSGTFLHQFGSLRVRQRGLSIALAWSWVRRVFGGP
jgi:hypothetical protein